MEKLSPTTDVIDTEKWQGPLTELGSARQELIPELNRWETNRQARIVEAEMGGIGTEKYLEELALTRAWASADRREIA